MHYFLFLEFIGTTELLVVLLVALIIFGPRKLPELSRSLAQAINQMRAASNDFKHTWEVEAEREKEASAPQTLPAAEPPALAPFNADPQLSGEEAAGVEEQIPVQEAACEPVMHAGAVFEPQPVELRV
jgi:Tat protein translocase TatB subunit